MEEMAGLAEQETTLHPARCLSSSPPGPQVGWIVLYLFLFILYIYYSNKFHNFLKKAADGD